MRVASREMCKRLYYLTGLKGTDFIYNSMGQLVYWPPGVSDRAGLTTDIPAYDLDFLLGILPKWKVTCNTGPRNPLTVTWMIGGGYWSVGYGRQAPINVHEDELAEAACKLAIKLAEKGEL